MTQAASNTSAVQAARARTGLAQSVRALLHGSGLDIRELTNHLVISAPGHPEYGRIYIGFTSGDVSLRRCTWDYLGHLDGYGSNDPEAEPALNAGKIIATLTGQTDSAS